MSGTGSDGAKDVFLSHENIVRKEYPLHQNYSYVGINTQSSFRSRKNYFYYFLFWLEVVVRTMQ